MRHWLIPAALFALAPKCFFCVAAYLGIGVALGISGPEMCDAAPSDTGSWMNSLVLVGVALGTSRLLFDYSPCFFSPSPPPLSRRP